MERLYDKAFGYWHQRAKHRCWSNPEWAEIERRRKSDGGPYSIFISEEQNLGVAEFERQREIFDEMNPRPWWLRTLRAASKIYRALGRGPQNLRFAHQRLTRGYSDKDLWNFDSYLAKVISGGASDLARLAHGYPDGLSPEIWDAKLKLLAQGFRDYNSAKYDGEDFGLTLMADPASSYNQAFDVLREYFGSLWD